MLFPPYHSLNIVWTFLYHEKFTTKRHAIDTTCSLLSKKLYERFCIKFKATKINLRTILMDLICYHKISCQGKMQIRVWWALILHWVLTIFVEFAELDWSEVCLIVEQRVWIYVTHTQTWVCKIYLHRLPFEHKLFTQRQISTFSAYSLM